MMVGLRNNLSPPKPKEHGAWGILYIPFLISLGLTGKLTLPVLLLFVAVTLLFLSQRPLAFLLNNRPGLPTPARRRQSLIWLAGYWIGSALLLGILILHYQLSGLLWFGLVGCPIAILFMILVKYHLTRTVGGELVGVIGLTMTAPMSHYVAVEEVQRVGLLLWSANILYFAGGIFYVKGRVQRFLSAKSKRSSPGIPLELISKIYHGAVLALLLNLVLLAFLPSRTLLAFVPTTVRALWPQARADSKLNFTRIGWLEVAYSLFFAAAMVWAFRFVNLERDWLDWIAGIVRVSTA